VAGGAESGDSMFVRSAILDAAQELEELETRGAGSGDSGGASSSTVRTKVASTVEVPGKGLVYKMRVITELNETGGGPLSLDRLRRVQTGESAERPGSVPAGVEEVGLFDDVAVHFEEGPGEHLWFVGRVQKMYKQLPGKRANC
jgi:hypothetical protein